MISPDWQSDDGSVTLYCADCRNALPGLTGIDAVVTDPPYGIGFDYPFYEDSEENLVRLIRAIGPILESAKRSLVFCSSTRIDLFPRPRWIAALTWNTTGSYSPLGVCQWNPILFYGTDVGGFGSSNGVLKGDVISINGGPGVGFRREQDIDHPCPKSPDTMRRILLRFTMNGETILDPFMGSGTTGVAAVRLGRKFIGIEIERKYFDIAVRRVQDAIDSFALFEQPKAKEPDPVMEFAK